MNKHVNSPAVQYAVVLTNSKTTSLPGYAYVVHEFDPAEIPEPFDAAMICKAVFPEQSAALEYAGYLQWRFYTKY